MPRADVERSDVEIWGGIECTHVRIGGAERDQCLEGGHRDRPGDLDLIAGLGLRTLRYPLLWATVEKPDGSLDFSWHDAPFKRLRELGVRPVAGFLHHGSGPGGLEPLHPDFVPRFADYAEAAAARFDWIDDFTPINEPVTTARFAYLYGHWHPHKRNERLFLRAVVAKARATQEAMRRIRLRNPRARLIQTEDVGRVFSLPSLAYQADYENERRYLGFDLLAGRVDRNHRFWGRLIAAGAAPRDLAALRDAPCPPDVIGIDYYLTSDRFLDDDLARHPGAPIGGNGRHAYVDVSAAHVMDLHLEVGILARLRETHARYGLPVAVTEVHNGCTREEQLRWLIDVWRAGQAARAEACPWSRSPVGRCSAAGTGTR
jgi:dTDP-4-dehydrorhamnose reductase